MTHLPEVGIVLANAGVVTGSTTPDELLGIAELADCNSGWDYVWVGDGLLAAPRLDSVVLLSACAARTRRVRLGVGCQASLGLRHPIVFTLQWASLDVLSNGRVTLVACPGPSRGDAVERELAAFKMEHSDKVGRMEEAIALLRQASTFGRLTWRSQHISLDNVELKPSFVQRPIPIWMVANPTPRATPSAVDRALARVADLGDGWMTFAVPPSALAERITRLKQLRVERGRVESELRVCLYIDVNVNVNEAVAIDDAVRTCKLEGRQNATPEQLMSIAAIGSATRCAEFIKRLIDAGATDLALRPVTQHPIPQMELITELLLPQIKPTLTADSVTTS